LAALGCAALLACGGLAAAAAEQTREGYVAEVEPICKSNTVANERILKGVRTEIRRGKLKLAGGRFKAASAAFGRAVKQIAAVPQPESDRTRLGRWLGYLDDETKYLGEIGKALKAEKKIKAQRLSVLLNHNGNLANLQVLGFEFVYCEIKPSRFS
jgi:hypothetical protein